LFFTGAFRIYLGIWPAVTVKFRANQVELGGFLSGANVSFCLSRAESDRARSAGRWCAKGYHLHHRTALDFSDPAINIFAREFECNSKLSLKTVFDKNLRSYEYRMELFL